MVFSLFKTEREISTTVGYQSGGYVSFIEIGSPLGGFSEITSENHFVMFHFVNEFTLKLH